jgi:hypothetical protein
MPTLYHVRRSVIKRYEIVGWNYFSFNLYYSLRGSTTVLCEMLGAEVFEELMLLTCAEASVAPKATKIIDATTAANSAKIILLALIN